MSFDHSTDEVKFGEVAMEPPSLSAKPRKAIETDEKQRVSELKFSINRMSVFMVSQQFAFNKTGMADV